MNVSSFSAVYLCQTKYQNIPDHKIETDSTTFKIQFMDYNFTFWEILKKKKVSLLLR